LLGSLRLSTAFSRFGFIVPRGRGDEASVPTGQLRRSDRKEPWDIARSSKPTAAGDGRKGVTNGGIANE
jgi:hypothetical protein